MSVALKFVKGAYLTSYTDPWRDSVDLHTIQVHRLLRIKSKTKPPANAQMEFDLLPESLGSVRRVHVRSLSQSGLPSPCTNDHTSLSKMVEDELLDEATGSLIAIDVASGYFSYPHGMIDLPKYPGKRKPFGWIQVDFPAGPVGIDLLSDTGANLGSYTVSDGQDVDIASYVAYKYETGAIDEESLKSRVGSGGFTDPDSYKVLEQGDGMARPLKKKI